MSSELPSFGSSTPGKLGSLAQSARLKNLNQAKGTLIAIGILTIVINGIQLIGLRDAMKQEINNMVEAERAKAHAQGMELTVDSAKLEAAQETGMRVAYLIAYSVIGLGILFVVFGLIVKTFPVPITIISLVLYLGATAIFAYLAPETIVAGIIFKVIIVIGLAKAIQSAVAYESDRRVAATSAGSA
jgi:predicted RND superfamily exporter protein